METYELDRDALRGLARGHGDPETIALLVDSQISRRRLYLVEAARRMPAALDALRVIARLDRSRPAAGRRLLTHPFLDAWFAAVVRDPDDPAPASYLGALAAATAAWAGLPFELGITAGRDLVLPGLGVAAGVGPGRCEVRFDGAVLRVGPVLRLRPPFTAETPGWRPAPRVTVTGHAIEIMDADPLRDRFPQPPLAPGDDARLAELIAAAWALLEDEQPAQVEAMRLALRGVVPLCTPPDGQQVSASVRGTFGAIGLSRPADPASAAELLVHEFQHEKMNALLDLVSLCDDRGPARFHAPWRPDARPASALVQGCYAFMGVAGFWRERRRRLSGREHRRAELLFASWTEQVTYALAQLRESGELTAEGAWFFGEANEVVASWRDESPASPIARRSAEATHIAWRLAHHRPEPDAVARLAEAWQRDLPPPAYGPPVLVAEAIAPPPDLARVLEHTWLDEQPPPGITPAEQALALGEPHEAARLLAAPGSDRDWVALAVALHATGARSAYQRPDLLRAVHERVPAPDPVRLALFLDRAPARTA